MPEIGKKMSSLEFKELIKEYIEIYKSDAVAFHSITDILMQSILRLDGYSEGIDLIKKQKRYYSK